MAIDTSIPSPQPASASHGLRDALAITLLGGLLVGMGCFVVAGPLLWRQAQTGQMGLFEAAVWCELVFAAAMGAILAVIILWQRSRGSSLKELGWRQPTTPAALALAVFLGVAYLTGSYFGAQQILPGVDVTQFNWTRLALAPVGVFLAVAEETMMRGFFMTQLQKAGVSTWRQIFTSGACSALYHSLQDPTPLGFFPSFVLFTLHAALYVFGRRSLTPVILAHNIYHVFGQTYLLMMALTAIGGTLAS